MTDSPNNPQEAQQNAGDAGEPAAPVSGNQQEQPLLVPAVPAPGARGDNATAGEIAGEGRCWRDRMLYPGPDAARRAAYCCYVAGAADGTGALAAYFLSGAFLLFSSQAVAATTAVCAGAGAISCGVGTFYCRQSNERGTVTGAPVHSEDRDPTQQPGPGIPPSYGAGEYINVPRPPGQNNIR